MPVVVTGYVPLPCGHRSESEYLGLGCRLQAADAPSVTFRTSLADCWLHQELTWRGYTVPPAGKDSLAYFCVQHQKSEWLASASRTVPSGTLVWIDFGILHLHGVTMRHVNEFLTAVRNKPPQVITSPSCGNWDTVDGVVNWTFCGGVLVVPSRLARWFHLECMAEQRRHPPTWEVNTWARVAKAYPDRFAFYPADHDATMFTGYYA